MAKNSKTKPKRKRVPVQVGDKTFESIMAFCDAYGLKYPTVSVKLRKGVPPEQILADYGALPTTTRYKADSKAAIPCSYGDMQFPSIVAASDALGIPPHYIATCMKARHCSVNDALKYLMEERSENFPDMDSHGPTKPCCVDGVLYPSQSAACQAYGVRYISVQSRMKRNGLTFEEALTSGGFKRKYVQPMLTEWGNLKLQEFSPADTSKPLKEIVGLLSQAGLEPSCLYDGSHNVAAVKVLDSLHALEERREILFLVPLSPSSTVTNIEMVMPCLQCFECLPQQDAEKIPLLLNDIMKKYTGVCIVFDSNAVRVSDVVTVSIDHINKRIFLRAYHQFLGTAASIYDECSCFQCSNIELGG